MPSKKLFFPNAQDQELGARLDLPDQDGPTGMALFAHCFTCSKNLKAVNHISHALQANGFGVFRFDFTGLGESEGDFADTNFSSNVEDLVAAADFMTRRYDGPHLLIGHSLGGAAVLQAASRIETAVAVATIAAPCNPDHVTHLLQDARSEIEAKGEARVVLAGRPFTIKKQFLDDLEGQRMDKTIRSLLRALLIFHSPLDQTVGIDNAGHIFEQAKHPKSFISLDKADHLLTRETDARFVGKVLAAWAARYIRL